VVIFTELQPARRAAQTEAARRQSPDREKFIKKEEKQVQSTDYINRNPRDSRKNCAPRAFGRF
jgi:hypothetical protein